MKNSWLAGAAVVLLIAAGVYYVTRDTESPANSDVTLSESETQTPSPNENGETAAPSANQNTVLGVLNAHAELSAFAAIVNRSSSRTALGTAGQNYTLFVPTNGALALLPRGTLSNLTQAEINELVRNHMIAKRVDVRAIETGYMDTMAGHKVTVDIRDQDESVLVGSGFVVTSYATGNGIVYVISAPLLIPEE